MWVRGIVFTVLVVLTKESGDVSTNFIITKIMNTNFNRPSALIYERLPRSDIDNIPVLQLLLFCPERSEGLHPGSDSRKAETTHWLITGTDKNRKHRKPNPILKPNPWSMACAPSWKDDRRKGGALT